MDYISSSHAILHSFAGLDIISSWCVVTVSAFPAASLEIRTTYFIAIPDPFSRCVSFPPFWPQFLICFSINVWFNCGVNCCFFFWFVFWPSRPSKILLWWRTKFAHLVVDVLDHTDIWISVVHWIWSSMGSWWFEIGFMISVSFLLLRFLYPSF